MPKTLNPINTFPTSIPNFPQAGNNEPVAIGPLEAAIQAVLNRTENLHQSRLVVEGAGIKRIQRLGSLSALAAATGFNDGDTVDVEGYGRYRLYNPSTLGVDGLWVLNAAGGGRWVHTLNGLRGDTRGLVTKSYQTHSGCIGGSSNIVLAPQTNRSVCELPIALQNQRILLRRVQTGGANGGKIIVNSVNAWIAPASTGDWVVNHELAPTSTALSSMLVSFFNDSTEQNAVLTPNTSWRIEIEIT